MPDKQLTVATYAAGASLAAITLVYVFAPTFFIDGESANSASSRKKGVVGLSNSANDCFINSVLQALAGLGDLRLYLIRETHRRKLDGPEVYAHPVPDPARQGLSEWKIQGEQEGIVTHGLKDILDALNERPLYKKTISPTGFISCLELAFKQRVSRQQQDAQEFLQILAERLSEEYHAGHRARNHARSALIDIPAGHTLDAPSARQNLQSALKDIEESEKRPTIEESETSNQDAAVSVSVKAGDEQEAEKDTGPKYSEEAGFPLEGASESQIECLTCGFKPEPTKSTFCVLTLSVPQVSATSLSSCFDQLFKTEYIEGFKCERCRLVHALNSYQQELAISNSEKFKTKARNAVEKIQAAIETNPEAELKGVELPNTKFAPKRKIAKHVRITRFPKIMAIHLSRSIFEERLSIKNSAKVAFPERLPLGGLLEQRMYKLLSVVCHKGSHHAGHYESFRRQNLYPPFSTPNTFQASGVYSKSPTPNTSRISTPIQRIVNDTNVDSGIIPSTPELLSPPSASSASLPLTNGRPPGTSIPSMNGRPPSATAKKAISSNPTSQDTEAETGSIRSVARSARDSISSKISKSQLRSRSDTPSSPHQPRPSTNNTMARESISKVSLSDIARARKKKIPNNRWWRISDEKIKESKTSDVLSMQKEVYLLFYELETGNDEA